MTAEPIRQPDDEPEEPSQRPEDESRAAPDDAPRLDGATPEPGAPAASDAPAASELIPDTESSPVTTADESLTPEAAASAEAAAAAEADPNMDPNASEAAVATADAQEVATTAQAVATLDAATDAPAAPAAEKGSRRRALGLALRQVAVVAIGLTLLVAGIALGNYAFQTTRPAPAGGTGDPGVGLSDPPAATQEFISALAVNDADAVRSALDQEPHIDLMREMERRGIQKIDSIQVLGTSVDGPRAATEILMQFEREDGISSAINLVILTDGGKIEGFR